MLPGYRTQRCELARSWLGYRAKLGENLPALTRTSTNHVGKG